jgi:AcrR family transcriptional regulator
MAQPRRMGVEGSKQRELLVKAAEQLLREEGYAAISARKVTSKAGLKTQLLYYYFHTMDDLILEVVRRITENRLKRFEEALASSDPLKALWELNSDPTGALMAAELTALAGHRESIRTQVIRQAREFRALQVEAVSRLLAQAGVDQSAYPAAGIVLIASAVARTITSEAALGLTDGHKEALTIIQRALGRYGGQEVDPKATRRAGGG